MNILTDIKFALRLLVKQPASSALAVLVMALGTGVAITMLAFVNGVLWSSLGLKTGNDLLIVEWEKNTTFHLINRGIGIPDFEVFEKKALSYQPSPPNQIGTIEFPISRKNIRSLWQI